MKTLSKRLKTAKEKVDFTSTYTIEKGMQLVKEIASATKSPERVIGMHFFNPVPLMELIEIVCHDGVSEETVTRAREIGSSLGKSTIEVRDFPGFATSRLGVVLGNEAIRMLAE